MRQALIDQKGWTDEELPHVNTIGEILNRLGYKMRRVQKTKPLKKIAQTDAIFANVRQENQVADDSPEVVRISMDAKAKVDVGDFSRDGESRAAEAPRALDHDTQAKTKLVPYGLLNVTTGLLTIIIGTSHETSDFIVDCLEQWWEANKAQHPKARRLVINLDNGPENSSVRTQFLYRLVKFSDATGLEVQLVYYSATARGVVGSVSLASFKSGLWARLLRWTMTSWDVIWMAPGVSTNFRYNLDGPAREALETFAQPVVQQVRQHRQGQVEIHVQANLATQAIEMKERDLFT